MYTVDWLPSAEQDLADIWNNASDRAAVSTAADMIDASLKQNPLAVGEARSGVTRILFYSPLAVLFDVDIPAQKVKVWDIWRWPA